MVRHRPIAATLALGLTLGAAGTAGAKTDWPTYGFDSLRSSNNPGETSLGVGNVGSLTLAWHLQAGSFDHALDPTLVGSVSYMRGQAVVASDVIINGVATDVAYVGDNNGTFFALDLNTTLPGGSVIWYRRLPTLTVPTPRPHIAGVFGAATFDRAANGGAGAVYVGVSGQVFAMDMATGADLPNWPLPIVADPHSTTDGAMHTGGNLVNGQLYVTTAASGFDTPPFWGRVVRIDTASASISGIWFTLSGNATQPAAYGGGIWGWGGVAVDPAAKVGGVYAATGNSFTGTGQTPLFAEQVVSLSRDLRTTLGHASPTLASGDYDYGSSPTVFQPAGCPVKALAVKNKTGLLVLEGIGPYGGLQVAQTVRAGAPESAAVGADTYRGTLAWDAATQQLLVTSMADGPAPFTHGLTAFAFNPACAAPYLKPVWHTTLQQNGQPVSPNGTEMSSPTIANGVAYFGAGQANSLVFAVAIASSGTVKAGQVLWQSPPLPGCTANTTMTVVNGKLLVPCAGPQPGLYVFALPPAAAAAAGGY